MSLQIWLPPSEGKTSPTEGPNLDLAELVYPQLTAARREVIAALAAIGDGSEATKVLKLGVKSASEASLNLNLYGAPAAKAMDLYTGVLFDALNASDFTAEQQARFNSITLIASALFGFVRPGDMVPNHRLAIGVNLPPLGALAKWWRPRLEEALGEMSEAVVFDVRSGGYRAAVPALAANRLELSVIQSRGGQRKVVTHMAKKWRGLVVSHLVRDPNISKESSLETVLGSLEQLVAGSNSAGSVGVANAPRMSLEATNGGVSRQGGSLTHAALVYYD